MNDNDLNYATAQDPAAYVRAPVPPTPREEVNAIIDYSDEYSPEDGIPLSLSVFGVFLPLHPGVDITEKRAELRQAALRWLEERR